MFTSPNYNSTPDSASCRGDNRTESSYSSYVNTPGLKQDLKCCGDLKKKYEKDSSYFGIPVSGKSFRHNNHSTLRNYTPPPSILRTRSQKKFVIC